MVSYSSHIKNRSVFINMNARRANLALVLFVPLLAIATINGSSVHSASALKNSIGNSGAETHNLSSSHNTSGGGGGAVPLIPISTGNPQTDKQINQFYSCIKKTGHTGGTHPEPSRDEVVGCYSQVFTNGNGQDQSLASVPIDKPMKSKSSHGQSPNNNVA
jgi:hypothetical protein